MHTHGTFRILLFNLGYCTGLDGSLADYLLRSWHYLYTPNPVIHAVQNGLRKIIVQERPDFCCFLELHHDHGLFKVLRSYRFRHVEPKYGTGSMLRRLPFFRDNCNGVFAKTSIRCRIHEFHIGMKRLVHELQLSEDVSLFLAHFSLQRSIRERQFAELAELVRMRPESIVCGDFNTFDGMRELHPMLRDTGLRVIRTNHHATFPAAHPRKLLDMFLCTSGIARVRARVLHAAHISDHLPVLLDVERT